MRIILLLVLSAVLLNGCGTGPAKPDAEQTAAAEAARAEMEAGNYSRAAEQFSQLADDSRGELATGYRIDAAEAYIEAGDPDQTRILLEQVEIEAEEQPQLFVRERLLEAQLALTDENAGLALERLEGAFPPDTQSRLQGRYHLLQARAYEQQDRSLDAVEARLAADHVLRDQPERQAHADKLWQALQQLDRAALKQLRQDARGAAAGWLDLALIEKAELTDPANLRRTLDDWQLQYPDHPAVDNILPELREFAENVSQAPKQIGVILPFSSAYSDAARIIRDGLMAGWYQDDNERPAIRIYDAGQQNIVSVYDQAVDDGADMIIGPLQKNAVSTLVSQGSITVPTLALNHYEGDSEAVQAINQTQRLPLLYQFSLSPENEARQIAERTWSEGHSHALAMTPANEWGDRVFKAFRQAFEDLGGTVLERSTFQPGEQQFSTRVQTLLNIDNSKQRYEALRDQLQRSLKSEPRRRQDADFLMLASYPAAGHQIGPQLQYHRANDLPVYATSHIYSGINDRSSDADLNGFIFADMPWVLNTDQAQSPMYQALKDHWPDRMESSPRLYALGIDAYRILSRLTSMALDQTARFDGVSGRLSIDRNGHVQRQLVWAKFVDGIPRTLDDGKVAARY